VWVFASEGARWVIEHYSNIDLLLERNASNCGTIENVRTGIIDIGS
jgi:hypothetical protein